MLTTSTDSMILKVHSGKRKEMDLEIKKKSFVGGGVLECFFD